MKPKSKRQIKDDTIIGTNSYSMVSKRSVEKLYFADEPSFLRAFVSKFRRRAPLINRGYWLRMRAIEKTVNHFLNAKEHGKKVVVNLGCGEDTLPFRTLWKRQRHGLDECNGRDRDADVSAIEDVVFVDVDYPELIRRKVKTVLATPLLRDSVGFQSLASTQADDVGPSEPNIFLQTPTYVAIGADLSDLASLSRLLCAALNVEDFRDSPILNVLFLAEVSITYMDTHASDAVISWARSAVPSARSHFCLLEQILPAGKEHPFARTMLHHFKKSAPLQSVETYSTLHDQCNRFKMAGWGHVDAKSLWDAWQDRGFLSNEDRRSLDDVEIFDEWEEFALFSSHYVFLVASSHSIGQPTRCGTACTAIESHSEVQLHCEFISASARRFAAPVVHGSQIASVAGFDSVAITRISQILTKDATKATAQLQDAPEPVACHTITRLNDGSHLLVGGRTSPSKASSKAWILPSSTSSSNDAEIQRRLEWHSAASMEIGRFRHCAILIGRGDFESVLIFGGKSSTGQVLDDWRLWRRSKNVWSTVQVDSKSTPSARFGGVLVTTQMGADGASGWLFGGMDANGLILDDFWKWNAHLDNDGIRSCQINFSECSERLSGEKNLIYRFGATSVSNTFSGGTKLSSTGMSESTLIGGVGREGTFQLDEEIVTISDELRVRRSKVPEWITQRPLLVGHSTVALDDDIMILGGGAVCFSFGSCWNDFSILLRATNASDKTSSRWKAFLSSTDQSGIVKTARSPSMTAKDQLSLDATSIRASPIKPNSSSVPKVDSSSILHPSTFTNLLVHDDPSPFVFASQSLGLCTSLWTPSYLSETIGLERRLTIHSSKTAFLDFNTKNFSYTTVSARDFIASAVNGSHVYLRSLAVSEPARIPASLAQDFPSLAKDFALPAAIASHLCNPDEAKKDRTGSSTRRIHSTVLRIAGDVNMWLHYDTHANILCQVRGRKRVVLFHPSDVGKLAFAPGSTTSSADVFGRRGLLERWQRLGLRPSEATLGKGDVLFIPACWPHATAPTGGPDVGGGDEEDGAMNVAVNVFFQCLDEGYAAGKDVYGNRDLEAYQNGRRDVERMRKAFSGSEPASWEHVSQLANVVRGDGGVIHGDSAGMKDARAIRTKLKRLPTQLREFYAERLAAEVETLCTITEKA